jgi:predicted AlkP superfamily pyrophosphatase or phosphodiesterase
MKVVLILVDGMRPDSMTDLPKAQEIAKRGASTMTGTTVLPSITLPCHMSLFHSVDPSRHGTTTNTYAPQVRPIRGLFEVLTAAKKWGAMYYTWQELRDVVRPANLIVSSFHRGKIIGYEKASRIVAKEVVADMNNPDYPISFAFAYLGHPDEAGHASGWMGEEYMAAVKTAWDDIDNILKGLPEDCTVIITADHGGHDRIHGYDLPEDMTIPMIAIGPDFAPGSSLDGANIKDIAPTVVKLLGVEPDEDWEGKSLF